MVKNDNELNDNYLVLWHYQTVNFLLKVSLLSSSLLRGAEEMGLRKAVKPEFGGGTRSFSCEEDYIYENIESELCFFTSQVSVGVHMHAHIKV